MPNGLAYGTAVAAILCFSGKTADTQTSGLLLGIAEDTSLAADMAPTAYETLWIAPVNGRLVIPARQKGIVTPRADGWWRFDVAHGCVRRPGGSALTRERLQTPGTREQLAFDTWAPLRADDPACARPAGAARREHQVNEENEPCVEYDVRIDYAGPRYIAITTFEATYESCTPFPRWETHRSVLNERWENERFLEHLDSATAAALTSGWKVQSERCVHAESPDEDWGMQRGKGAWQAVFKVYDSFECREEGEHPEWGMPTPLPASLTVRDSAEAWGSRIQAAVPGGMDYFVSPAADLIAVRAGGMLRVYATSGAELGAPVLDVPLPVKWRVVMAEWALGRHVARWTAELSR